ncbi:hypothetical protein ACFQ7N_09980 [Streptomyces niveus]|uniref:hypothetical protein n=1 Tax=Streptomyces niveus TaxID=193462 RepID=UPI0036C01BD0
MTGHEEFWKFCRFAAAAVAGLVVGAVAGLVLLAVVRHLPDAWWPRIGDVFPQAETAGRGGPAEEEREAGVASLLSPPEGLSVWQAVPAVIVVLGLLAVRASTWWRRR